MNQQQHQQPENLVNWLDNTFIGRILTMPNLEVFELKNAKIPIIFKKILNYLSV
jgi:hypothetical protein